MNDAVKKRKQGFTLIELLVVVAIIALLLSILLPGLKMAKNYAKRVVCGAGLKQIGMGLKLYADAFSEYLPDDHNVDGSRERHTYVAYRFDNQLASGRLKPYRFAYLYELDYIEVPEIFYCPGNNALITPQYVYESYINPTLWGTLPQDFNVNTSNEWVRVGYTYYPVESSPDLDPASYAPRELATKFINLNPNIPVVSDLIHNLDAVSHQNSGKYALNAMFQDGHVTACTNQDLFKTLLDPAGRNVWETLGSDAFPEGTKYYDTAIYSVFRAIGP